MQLGSDLFSGLDYPPWFVTALGQRGNYCDLQAQELKESGYDQRGQVWWAKLRNSLDEKPEVSLWLREDLELEGCGHLSEPSD